MNRRFATILAVLLLGAGLVAAAPAPAAAEPLDGRPVSDDIFYMYMPIAWRDSDSDTYRFGDFGGMTAALPYLESLGVTAVWMTPIFPSPAYHGYQHGPADSINTWFGSRQDFLDFVQAAHAESIKVFIDFVAYGISQNTVWFQDSYGNPPSLYDDWLAYSDSSNTSYIGCCPYSTWNGSTVGFIHWDLRNPTVTQMVTDWAKGWLDPNADQDPADGIDGYRLDHVSAYDPVESPWGYDIAWWEAWKAELQSVNPDVFTFAEQADWGSFGSDLLTAHDAAFTKPFESYARYGLEVEDARYLSFMMELTLQTLPAGRTYLTTLGNHDVDRLASALDDVPGRLRAAAAVLMLQPLPPVIYFGDELGMRGTKQPGYSGDASDIPFREPFKWNAVAGPPMSNYFVLNNQAYNNRVERNHDGRSVEEQDGDPGSLLELYRKLGALRRAHQGLRRGQYTTVENSDSALWTFVKSDSAETLLVAINLSQGAANAVLDLLPFEVPGGSSDVIDVETGQSLAAITTANQSAYPLSLAPYDYRVLRAELVPLTSGRNIPAAYTNASLVLTQDTPTAMGDNQNELDQLFARPETDGLALGITGNLALYDFGLALFFDTQAGGQNVLGTSGFPQPPSGIPQISGMVMDSGFSPDVVLYLNAYGGVLYVDRYRLDTGGGGEKRYVGSILVNATGTLSGGDNPNGLTATYANGNLEGVTASSAATAATATQGFELLIPWEDLELAGPGSTMGLMAMLLQFDGRVGNQFLPGLGGVAGYLGYVPLDLNGVSGQQYASFSTTIVADAPGPAPGISAQLALLGTRPNPARGALNVAFELASQAPAKLELFDVSGRRLIERELTGLGQGVHVVALADGRRLPEGLYLVRLTQGAASRSAKVAVVH